MANNEIEKERENKVDKKLENSNKCESDKKQSGQRYKKLKHAL